MNKANENSSELDDSWKWDSQVNFRPPPGFTAVQISRKIGHELRSQLTGTSGLLDMLLESDLNTNQRIFAESIKCSTMTMLFVVNGIHDMIRLENGTFQQSITQFDMARLLEDQEFLFKSAASERGLQLEFSLIPDFPEMLLGDAKRLGVILYHLINNAILYSDSGMVRISARVIDSQTDTSLQVNHRILFSVSDEGDGIPEEVREAFVTNQSISHYLFKQNGMGLLTCRELVINLGGQIRLLTPTHNTGTMIQFWLPFSQPRPNAKAADFNLRFRDYIIKDKSPPTDQRLPQNTYRVLLADDDPVNRRFVAKFLGKNGINTDCVGNGSEAIHSFLKNHYDLIILDCHMPIMDGFKAVQLIREIDFKNNTHTPIIVWSATNTDTEKSESLHVGADEFIQKPVDSQFLLEMVTRRLSNSDH